MDLGELLLLLSFGIGLAIGPIIVARVFPSQTGVQGTALAGQSGASALFWGLSLGLTAGLLALALLIVLDPVGGPLLIRIQTAAVLFVGLGSIMVPLIVCGFHRWHWGPDGLEFVGVFRRVKIAWADIRGAAPTADGGQVFETRDGTTLRTSEYTVGAVLIAAAFARYRADLVAPTAPAQ